LLLPPPLLLLLLLQSFYVGMSRSHSDRLVYIHIGEWHAQLVRMFSTCATLHGV
jgi:hypothetical protein